jgi:hypothetical protein
MSPNSAGREIGGITLEKIGVDPLDHRCIAFALPEPRGMQIESLQMDPKFQNGTGFLEGIKMHFLLGVTVGVLSTIRPVFVADFFVTAASDASRRQIGTCTHKRYLSSSAYCQVS